MSTTELEDEEKQEPEEPEEAGHAGPVFVERVPGQATTKVAVRSRRAVFASRILRQQERATRVARVKSKKGRKARRKH